MEIDRFPNRTEASLAAAQFIGDAICHDLDQRDYTTIAVSGGTSPIECFGALSKMKLDWSKVNFTLTDERCVPPSHPDSNSKLIRDHLLVANAADAAFHSLDGAAISQSSTPFACCLLGMGADGHFASLFPDATNLAEGLSLSNAATSINIRTSASPYRRLSLTFTRILNSQVLALLVFGDEKRAVLENPMGLPIEHLLTQQKTPLNIFWAP